MKVYGRTDDIIVREMTETDAEKFLEYMTECGANEDFTVDDIKYLWKLRNKKGDVQCTITSTDGSTVYGFCGILHSRPGTNTISFFKEYDNEHYRQQVKEMLRC